MIWKFTQSAFLAILMAFIISSCTKGESVFIAQKADGMQTYYWADNKRIPVIYDYKVWSVKTSANIQEPKAEMFGLTNSEIVRIMPLTEHLFRIDLKQAKDLNSSKTADIEFTIPSLLISPNDENSRFLLNGEILLQAKSRLVNSVKVYEDISSLIGKYQLTKVEESQSDLKYTAKDAFNTLEISNLIYESGKIDWCHPNGWIKMILLN